MLAWKGVVENIYEVNDRLKFPIITYLKAVQIFHEFIKTAKNFNNNKVSLIGICCYNISSKITNETIFEFEDLKQLLNNKFSIEEIKNQECDILNTINFNIPLKTPLNYIHNFTIIKKYILEIIQLYPLIFIYTTEKIADAINKIGDSPSNGEVDGECCNDILKIINSNDDNFIKRKYGNLFFPLTVKIKYEENFYCNENIFYEIKKIKKQNILRGYSITNKIGFGTYSNVFSATKNKKHFALKKSNISKSDGICSCFITEMTILKKLKHPHIMEVLDIICFKNEYYYSVMECMDFNLSKKNLSFQQIKDYTRQILLGLSYIHKNKIIHCDLKPDNIMIKDNIIKIGDFGLSYFTGKKINPIQTFYYRAPEIFKNEDYSYPIDIWSLGCIFYEFFTKEILIKGNNNDDQLEKMRSISFDNMNLPPLAIDLLKKMIKINPNERITADDALQHPFFQ